MTDAATSHETPARKAADWPTRVLAAATAVAILFSLLARLTAAGRQPLWLDEAWTLAVASQPSWGEVIRHTWLDANAPLYYALMHLWGGVFGFSDASLRAPAILFGAMIPLPVLLVRLPGLPKGARLAWAAMLALWLPGLWFSEDARGYALLTLLCTAQTVAFVRLLDRPGVRLAALWTALSSLAILTHYHALVLGALQGLTYLAMRRAEAVRTWPAALVFAVPFGWIAYHAPRLVLFARPDVAWYGLLRPQSFERLLGYLVGSPTILTGAAVLALGAVLLSRLAARGSLAKPAPIGPEGRALIAAALTGLAGALIVIGLGYLRPSFTDRYLTPFAPGVLLGVALVFSAVSRRVPYVMAVLVGLFLLVAGLWWRQELKVTGRVYNYEVASTLLMRGRPERLVFLWDHPAHRIEPDDQLAAVGDAFFRRAGRLVATVAIHVGAAEDPSPKLAAAAAGARSAILWMYDTGVQGTAARRHPPHIEDFDPGMRCRNLGRGGIGIIACDRYGSVLENARP
jgi:uncharacterized membrane protein